MSACKGLWLQDFPILRHLMFLIVELLFSCEHCKPAKITVISLRFHSVAAGKPAKESLDSLPGLDSAERSQCPIITTIIMMLMMLKITDFLPVARCPPAGWPGERRSGRLSAATSAACNLAFCFLIRFASAGASGAVRGKKMTLCIKLAGWVSLPKSTVHRQQPRLPVRCSHVRPK